MLLENPNTIHDHEKIFITPLVENIKKSVEAALNSQEGDTQTRRTHASTEVERGLQILPDSLREDVQLTLYQDPVILDLLSDDNTKRVLRHACEVLLEIRRTEGFPQRRVDSKTS